MKYIAYLLVTILALVVAELSRAERIKDITSIEGVRSNQLIGYGLVVGLDGSGDQTNQTPFTIQSFSSMLKQLGITLPPNANFQLKNVAAVALHGELPPFAKPGQRIDVTASSIANAKSLRGGTLLMAPLKGIDGNIYAIAQGNLIVGGFGAEGADGSKITINIPSVGRIPDGAIVERAVPTTFGGTDSIVFNLHTPDFTTSKRVADNINRLLGPGVASPLDSASIRVQAPKDPAHRVDYLSLLENIEVRPADGPAKIIINSRTGTIVVGQHVRVQPVAITHGSLSVVIKENIDISQPNALGQGQTVVVPDSELEVVEESGLMFNFAPGPTLDDIVRAVNEVGAAPGDLMAILEALKESGALKAEIVVI